MPKVLIVHDYLNQVGGGEKVLELLLKLFINAEVYTLTWDRKLFPKINPKTSFIQFIPLKKRYRAYMPLFPTAVKLLKIPENSLILSSSHAYIKNIIKPKNSLHICYCLTPMRYAWDSRSEYLKRENVFLRPFIALFLAYLRHWDKKGSENVDYFIAISEEVADRIKKCYNRDSTVIYPPVNTGFFKLSVKEREAYYLIVSRLVEYKKVDLAIEAFKKLNKRLVIAGTGRDEQRLKKLAAGSENIVFKGFVSDKELLKYYQNAKAFINPQIEEFGITAVEAQSCGTPVIAYAKGGALETVVEGRTGHFFYEQAPEALAKAVLEFEKMRFDPRKMRKNALKYDKEIFKKKIKEFVTEKYRDWKRKTVKSI